MWWERRDRHFYTIRYSYTFLIVRHAITICDGFSRIRNKLREQSGEIEWTEGKDAIGEHTRFIISLNIGICYSVR